MMIILTDDGQILDPDKCTLVELTDDQMTALVLTQKSERIHCVEKSQMAGWYQLS